MAEYFLDVLDESGNVVSEIPLIKPAIIGRPSKEFIPDIEIPPRCRSASRQHATIEFQGDQMVLADHSTFGTIVNHTLIEHGSVPLGHGDEIVFGQPGDGWRVRFREPIAGSTTRPADPLELLIVSDTPRQVRIGRDIVDEHLGDRAFRLLKYLSDRKGSWYTTESLIGFLWPDPDRSPLQANEQLARHKKQINDLIRDCLDGQDAIEAWPHKGYRMRPRLEE